ncbi:uncharacterized protein TNCV_3745361 [Trichonephila clavipes]|nr:uncharacterized protein TNCV_3745361 [Trichonephila clavipes]
MQIAAKEAKYVSRHSDITVTIDGTWQKHGYTSLNGAVIAASFYPGKVLDASILSRFCKCPNKMHNENYNANQFGNSGSMEVSVVIENFQCSESLHGVLELVGYVEDLTTSFKTKKKGKKLSDKKTSDDHGRLADAEFDKLHRYYGLAIRNNTDSIDTHSIDSMYR